MTTIGVYGASGFGREVMPWLRSSVTTTFGKAVELVFIDDACETDYVNRHRVLTWKEFVSGPSDQQLVCLAIADSSIREMLANKCEEAGVEFLTATAASVVVLDDVKIGKGAVLAPFVTLTSNVTIGSHFHANLYSYVAHDCVIGDFVTFAPSVHCNGNVVIEDHAYVGTGATIRQGYPGEPIVIGRGAVIGMGAVVTRSVPAGTTVVGNPAKPLVKD